MSNAYRQRSNLAPLRESSALSRPALGHSQIQADQGVMSHDNFSARMAASGRRRCVENVAVGYRFADKIVAAWISSPGHDRNLRNPKAADLGIARDRGYTTWFACR